MLGPALGPGSLFALDATFVPRIPVPAGVWGLGPELPRRVPLGLILAWASPFIGGALAGKLLLASALVVAFAGAARLVGASGWATQLAAGLLYSLSPLMLTRVGAGEWTAVVAFAVLPWALPTLLTPSADRARTFAWAAAMGATGSVGGIFAVVVVAVGMAAERTPATVAAGALTAVAQLPWVVAGVVVWAGGPHLVGSNVFPTRARGLVGAAGLLAGHGFWRAPTQVGGDSGAGTAMLGIGLLVLAVAGAGALPAAWRWRAATLAGIGGAIALASAAPGVRTLYADFTRTTVGAPFRESQRFLILGLVWLAPAGALGARRLTGDGARLSTGITLAAPAAVAVVLGLPGLWGVGGRLRPVQLPSEWAAARRAVRNAPGTVLALPYHRYLDLPAAGDRRVFNPMPDYLGGDVISSSSLELGPHDTELDDPREPGIVALLARAVHGDPVSGGLAAVGVRWVVVLHTADWRSYASLAADPGLRAVVRGPTLDLFVVRTWRGPVVDASGRVLAPHAVVAPLEELRASGPAAWAAPAAFGWMRGSRPAGRTGTGLVHLPAGRGLLWFWPALVVLGADAAVLVALLAACRSLRTSHDAPLRAVSATRPPPTERHQPLQPAIHRHRAEEDEGRLGRHPETGGPVGHDHGDGDEDDGAHQG